MNSAYLNFVLSVIAGCLVWICVRYLPLVQRAQAQENQRAAKNYPANVIQCEARHIDDYALRACVMNLK